MDIGIFITFEGQVVQIPVNPSEFNVSEGGNNSTHEIISLGEIVIPRRRVLDDISWESWFPYESWFPAVRTKGQFESAQFYVDFIRTIRDARKPCRLTVTGIGYDEEVVIENFEWYHQGGDHEDTYYSIEFKRYQPYSVAIVQNSSTTGSTLNKPVTAVGTQAPEGQVSPKPAEITVGCEVILNGRVHYDSYGAKPGKTFTNYKGKVNFINKKGTHPYHVTTPSGGWLGWVTAGSVTLA